MIIGITGRGGSGKSTIAKIIKQYNPSFEYIEVDKLIETSLFQSNRLVRKVNSIFHDKNYIIEDIINSYFLDDEKNKKIHKIFLSEVEIAICEQIARTNYKNVIIEWFLLHELKIFCNMDVKILVELEKEERIKRVSKRSKTKNIEIFKKIDNNFNDIYLCDFDYVFNTIDNKYIEEIDKNLRWSK